MISVDKARARVLSHIKTLAPRPVPLMDALGSVLAEHICAGDPVPAFNNSAMDGYAVRSENLLDVNDQDPVKLTVVGELAAGSVASRTIRPRQAMRIMTGAPLPLGADAVVMVEHTERQGNTVLIKTRVWPGQNVRWKGEDIQAGQQVLLRGALLGAGAIGLLAGLGRESVKVVPRPRVAILSTGDELLPIHASLKPGKLRDSNSYALAALVKECGAEPLMMGIAADREDDLREKLERCLEADIVITSGGVSVGDFDLVKGVLAELGEMLMWKVGMRPGKPLVFGMVQGTPLFGLPGNPVAAMIGFENFVRPTIGQMAGLGPLRRPEISVELGATVQKRRGFRTFIGVILNRHSDGRLIAREAGLRSSGALRSMALADALLVLPEDCDGATVGDTVTARLLHGPVDPATRLALLSHSLDRPKQDIPIVSVVGRSNAGKTTLITLLIAEFQRRGRRVLSIEHDALPFEIDHPSEDSYRHFHAGARATIIASTSKIAMVRKVDREQNLESLVELLGNDIDLVLTDGHGAADQPKIEIVRQACSSEPVCSEDQLIAVATDVDMATNLPMFSLDDEQGICDFIEARFLDQSGAEVSVTWSSVASK